jgi:regulator of protease activity HflC (stomatin/prohibitin superfamily)
MILGLMLFIAGYMFNSPNANLQRIARPLSIAGVIFFLIGFSTSVIRKVGTGEVGVPSLFGEVQNKTLESGLNFVNPLDEVTMFDIKTQNYTMSASHDEGDKEGDDAIRVLTADGLEVIIDLTVLYRISPAQAPTILKQIGADYKDKIIRPITRTKIRDNAVYYDAVALYSTKRDEFQNRIFKAIDIDLKNRGLSWSNF